MTESLSEGSLIETPFARLLFETWQKERTGRLRLEREDERRLVLFEKGRVVIEREGLLEPEFLAALVKKRVLLAEQAKRCDKYAAAHGISRVRALGELGLLSPVPLWNLMESFFIRRLFAYFDWPDGRFAFEPGFCLLPGEKLGQLETLELILQGIRQMQNAHVMERSIPDGNEPTYVSLPPFLHRLRFEPHERYALEILSQAPNLKGFGERSEMAKKENLRVLSLFACLDILRFPEKRGDGRTPPELHGEAKATVERNRILNALNEKSAFIYRYVTKHIGPLARNIVHHGLEEIRPGLGPLFQKMKLLADGRIEVDAAYDASLNHLPEEIFQSLIRGFDEILMAEVLAVKKSLGSAHETSVVKSLEKIGCL
jgi:hypothetical protein